MFCSFFKANSMHKCTLQKPNLTMTCRNHFIYKKRRYCTVPEQYYSKKSHWLPGVDVRVRAFWRECCMYTVYCLCVNVYKESRGPVYVTTPSPSQAAEGGGRGLKALSQVWHCVLPTTTFYTYFDERYLNWKSDANCIVVQKSVLFNDEQWITTYRN